MATIVVLGWGSLIWDPRELPVSGTWNPDGPHLPIEFARQSTDGRITLCLAEGCPTLPVLWTTLTVERLDDARLAIATREGVPKKYIRRSVGEISSARTAEHFSTGIVHQWMAMHAFDALFWTTLNSGFRDDRGKLPSDVEVVEYLHELTGDVRKKAEEYVRRAPEQVRTPYRTVIEKELGWYPLAK